MEKKQTKGISVPNRMLRALEDIYNDPDATVAERLQALRLSAEILPYRKMPRRKSDKEKAILEALNKSNPNKKPAREYNFSKKKAAPEGAAEDGTE